jgi:hypothetical protein
VAFASTQIRRDVWTLPFDLDGGKSKGALERSTESLQTALGNGLDSASKSGYTLGRRKRTITSEGDSMPNQGTFELNLLDVLGQPAADPSTSVSFVRLSDNREISRSNGLVFPAQFDFPLPSFPQAQGLICWINPQRYRTCTSSIFTLTDGQILKESPTVLRTPAQWNGRFTHWFDLSGAFDLLRQVLTASPSVTVKESNQPLGAFANNNYDDVDEMPTILAKTALLNIYAKLFKILVPGGAVNTWFQFVRNILVIGRERFIGIVTPAMWDQVGAIHDHIDAFPQFVRADTTLHTGNIPSSFASQLSEMISIKSNDAHGNLQLTMAKCQDPQTSALTFLVDADIDEDLNFFLHAGDLFTHIFSGGTHPFDVHEILLSTYGALDLGYDLV